MIAVPELMRLLVDVRKLPWDRAWDITRQCFAYTCHTLLPEALEVWPVELLGRLLPRHLEIIDRINAEFLAEVRAAFPGDEMRVRRMSIISDYPERGVRMAFLATVAATKVNGVAALHSELLRDKVLPDFSELWPEKFINVTNGVTPRRFLRQSNPRLSELITEADRGRLGHRPRAAAPAWSRWPRTPSSGHGSARSSRPTRPGCSSCSAT